MTIRHYTALSLQESSVRVDSTKSHRATRQHAITPRCPTGKVQSGESSVRVDSTKSHRATRQHDNTTLHPRCPTGKVQSGESSVRVDSTKSHRATRQHDNMTKHRAVLQEKFSPGRQHQVTPCNTT
ncbi:hypothetical protein RRG08_005114 [Elysia crispata]|uniref:Uncharacterized protein n=1 Tax=Elysia crispata TaxID=231223 RepID=A0AAE1B4V4_9GAST|nr:hypothetical protein RRG08_005114 [Elysia crispata]